MIINVVINTTDNDDNNNDNNNSNNKWGICFTYQTLFSGGVSVCSQNDAHTSCKSYLCKSEMPTDINQTQRTQVPCTFPVLKISSNTKTFLFGF